MTHPLTEGFMQKEFESSVGGDLHSAAGAAEASCPPNALELFARELEEGWASWGNEPLRFQKHEGAS